MKPLSANVIRVGNDLSEKGVRRVFLRKEKKSNRNSTMKIPFLVRYVVCIIVFVSLNIASPKFIFLLVFFVTSLLSLTVVRLAERARLTMIDSRQVVFLEIPITFTVKTGQAYPDVTLKRGTGSGERGTGNGSLITSSQWYPR